MEFERKAMEQVEQTNKKLVVRKATDSKKFWMSQGEYTGIVVGKESTNGEYVISDGKIEPGGFIPDHYHKWEDQTFHVIQGGIEAKIGDETLQIGKGDTVHCPRGVSHYMKNNDAEDALLISYIFPGDRAEEFMAETSRQNETGEHDLQLIEDKFGVVYLKNN